MRNMARGMREAHLFTVFVIFSTTFFICADGQDPFDDLNGFNLNPPYFNLAEGSGIHATATCGEDEAGRPRSDLYCKLVGGAAAGVPIEHIQGQYCSFCNSNDPSNAHPVSNAIDGTERWWQSPPLSRGLIHNEVNVTLDLGQLFHVAYILIKFANSPRPDLWVLERSVDQGRTFTPWQYFAHSKRECIERFGKQPNARILRDDDQLCSTEYSRIVPLENGEIVVSLVNGRPGAQRFSYSPVLQDFTKATNIRLAFLRTNTLLGHLISKAQRDPTVTRRYFYSIKDISVGGRCVCHGHAQVCGGGGSQDRTNGLQCDCEHNTCGASCNRCCPGFNQKRWRAATVDSPNECQPCQCFSHAADCFYDPEVEKNRASLDTFGRYDGGGVCINCQHNTAGVNCELCVEGFFRPFGVPPELPSGCIPCRCDERTTAGCEMGSGRCVCKPQFSGENCERCADGYVYYPQCIRYPVYLMSTKSPAGPIVVPSACPPGYFGSPSCQQCVCDSRGTVREVCDASGRCLCRQGVDGERCERCQPGFHHFPDCQGCVCDGAGVAASVCGPNGQCVCLPNYRGQKCDECAPGYYGHPDCATCQCSSKGSYGNVCNPVSGQCLCLPGVLGQRCDQCASGLRFPQCSGSISGCNSAGTEVVDPQTGSCRCLENVEGTLCDGCRPLYWNLALANPQGCQECECDVKGTLSGVGDCQQKSGQCHCKPDVRGRSCGSCRDGYFQLHRKNYFGCQDCQCDIGGAVDMSCDGTSGQCRCQDNVVGRRCSEPAPNFYFPSLHQLKFEIEDGVTPNSRPVRFGFNRREFPDFSWRGYAVMSPAQPEVILTLPLGFPGPFHIVMRYSTPRHTGGVRVRARILLLEEAAFQSCCDSVCHPCPQSEVRVTVHVDPRDGRFSLFRPVLRFTNPSGTSVTGSIRAASSRGSAGSDQSTEVIFPQSPSPSFLTVPGEGFAEPFHLTPGKWILHLRAEGVLLDYLVLLPQDYYEAPLLREKITQPCTYLPTASTDANCLLYKHVPLDGFSSSLGSEGTLSGLNKRRRRRQAHVWRPTPDHPAMAVLSGRQSNLQLNLRVAHPGPYVLILEYASEVDAVQNLNMLISEQSGDYVPARANIYSCTYSFLCRSVTLDGSNRVSVLQLSHKTEVLMQTSTTSFLLYKVYAVPAGEFSMDYVEPKVLCVSTHGRFSEDSRHCIQSQFDKPASAQVLSASQDGRLSSAAPLQRQEKVDWRRRRQTGIAAPPSGGVLLKFPQTEMTLTPRESLRGRYVPLVHYRQPEHDSFPVHIRVAAGREWRGSVNASFCPAVSGCRKAAVSDGGGDLDFDKDPWQQPTISLTVPPNKTLVLDYILLVPDGTYTTNLLNEKLADKSADFIQQCRGEGFHIDPQTASRFCRESQRSLAAAYNRGALPCNCDQSGSTGSTCDPAGGQCSCRQHVIGRQCSRCATGHFGFPHCRPCECGSRRLCDEVTGECICPPQTVRPSCEACQAQTFSYHPLLGCDGCECSPTGIRDASRPDCDGLTGQCSCKPGVSGRRCDRCTPGHYGFPECVPCSCSSGGVSAGGCHPDSGRCLCKKHVGGLRCDACVDGSFHFDPSNPLGCTSCFCFGASSRCRSSSKRRGKFVVMDGWSLESLDQDQVLSVLNPASDTVVADVQELSPTVQTLHWVAPSSYLGNKVSSYGGFLTYQSKSFGVPSEGMTLMDRRPDVVLTGQNMTLVHMAPQVPLPDRLYQGRVQLLEGNWRHAINNRPVSREELMMVLADLVGVRIHALYFTQTQRLSLGEVGLEETSLEGTGGPGNTVEQCSCPPQYAGDSCERCSPGYHRDDSAPFGRCVPCECNGHTEECEDKTGRCLNCQYNTAGDRCERCKEGYYGDPIRGTCRVCPCPFSIPTNSFAVGCREVSGGFQCLCRPGYAGDKCQSCAPGYYGDPVVPGGRCQPCQCSGNGNNCDSRTGVCKNTLEPGDTDTDEQCQECDSCAQTLLQDLEKLDDELERIKSQLGNASASASSQGLLKKLEKNMADTKNLLNKLSSDINNQKPRIDQLDEDSYDLTRDINALKRRVQDRSADADWAVREADKTHKRAKDLNSEVDELHRRIEDLLQKLADSGATLPSNDLEKMLKDAEGLVKEMEKRNFTPQKTAAEKEKNEAKKLLEYVKANVSRQYQENNHTAQKLQDLLKAYEAKLRDLDQALKDAKDLVKRASVQNGLNGQALGDLQKRAQELKEERDTVKGQMDMARDELKKTQDLLNLLTDSQTEYERLAAQLDGAKNEVTKKVNEVSRAAAKEGVVVAAEKHAENLAKLAQELEGSVKNASGRPEVRNARDAIDAYKNITDAINAAAAAAKQAKAAADRALNSVNNQNLPERARDLKDNTNGLLSEAGRVDRDLKQAASDIRNLNKRLMDADGRTRTLQRNLQEAQEQLKNIRREDIRDMIDEAKRKAASANRTASDTMDRVNAIKQEVANIGGVAPGDGNLNKVLKDVDMSIKNLLQSLPTLENKISAVENLTSEFSQINNITGNIKKIKELIEQARDAANRISIPMKFSGTGHVELRPPKDLEDLKAYTSMSLSLQRPDDRGDGRRRRRQNQQSPDMFVLYLGSRDSSKNYMGLVVRNNVLHTVYKLNGQEYDMKTGPIITSPSVPAKFDRVDLNRIYQDAQMTLTKDITSGKSTQGLKANVQGAGKKNLLDLSPSDVVFYVGGYPANFTPPDPLRFPMYEGCIEFFSFNDRSVSLYNFQARDQINLQTPCKRYVLPDTANYYEGTGFSKMLINKKSSTFFISMSLHSRSENGLIAYLGTKDIYFAVTVEKGVVFLHSNLLERPATNNLKMFPTLEFTDVRIISTSKGEMKVLVASKEVASAEAQYSNEDFKEVYVGGIPDALRERDNITMQPFRGCLKNLKLKNDNQLPAEQVGIRRGCPDSSLVVRKAEFDLGSSLSAPLPDLSLDGDVTVSLGFKSVQNQGVIMQDKRLANGMSLGLDNGHVVLKFNEKMWKSNKKYNDDQWHYLTVTRTAGRTELLIDEEDEGQEESGSSIPDTGGLLMLGRNQFKGCVSNLYTRRPANLYKPEDLSTFTPSGDVLLDVCAADRPAKLMRGRSTGQDVLMQGINEMSPCVSPATVENAYRLYGSVSSLSFSLPLQVLQPRPQISLDVKTRAAEGLLFFAATRGGRAHLALYMSKGRIRLSVGKDKEIFNREKYNDGKWHTVMFSLEKKLFRLVVDGIRAQDGQMTNAELAAMKHFLPPLYLGSAPDALHKELKSKGLPKQGVPGCIRNFKMNGALMTSPSVNRGAGPCLVGRTQKGAYFAGNRAHVIVNDSFVLNSTLELLFSIRPQSPTGLLLHVGAFSRNQSTGHYLSVYMLRGEVVARANNGKGEIMVTVKPKSSLCDGTFHKISVIKRKNVVQLHVDTVDKYKIGPPSPAPPTKSSLYVGGVPETLVPQMLPVTASFVGCIQDMSVNSEPVSFERPPAVFGPVNLRECPG